MAKVVARETALNLRYRWTILGVCWLAYLVVFLERLAIPPLAPFLKSELGLTGAEIGLLMSASATGYALTLMPAGWLVDRIGIRRMLLVGEALAGTLIMGMFFVTSFTQALVFMFLAGLGMGCLMPSTTKGIVVWFPNKERATAMGFKQTALNLGGIITAATLPSLAIALGWRYGFLVIGVVAIAIGIISFIFYRDPPSGLEIAESKTASGAKPSLKALFQSRDIWLVIVSGFCMNFVEFAAAAYFVLYSNEVLLLPIVAAGLLSTFLQIGGGFGRPLAGFISDRFWHGSRKWLYSLMCAVAAICSVAFSLLGQGIPLPAIAVLALIFGFAGIGWAGLHLTLVGELAGKELGGTAVGTATAFVVLGNVFGPPAFGYLLDATGSYRLSWWMLTVVAAIATASVLFVRESKRRA